MTTRPQILLAFNKRVRDGYLDPAELDRLESFADWEWLPCEGKGDIYEGNDDAELAGRLRDRLAIIDGLVICHGAPTITADLLAAAPKLKVIGELEGDRFAARIDLEEAWARGVRAVDTTNGSSYPVAEWALALILVSMRQGGSHFRRIIAGDTAEDRPDDLAIAGSLHGKRVGLIGGGHMARRLMKLLRPFEVELWVHDPYLPAELPEAMDFVHTSLDVLLSKCPVIVCLAPLTPGTRGLLGRRELDLIASGSVLVNVSRGAVIDSAALIARLQRGDIAAGLDVFDPEPIPPDSEIINLPNVFLSPHIGWRSGSRYPLFFSLMVDELDRYFAGHQTYFDLTPRSLSNRRGDAVG